ncbi:TauD/TfdA family dioxygenase [Amycolatopsis rubida]|uniref:Taurine dioxygenase, alpha-ketoglutarate-dependent n=2 Tax=Amycolatopsis rubida TaxID=112413 RepID=A0A1I6AIT4_9PSEU|nr:TauD/TfdA family dioxygenase [Amycolatopsis rubida]SFQ68628.1 Taurine dioxygenase, alpha-ketoglutarate-dependent [Amycolatopsis rubida]
MTPRASGPRAGLRRRAPSGPGGGVRPIGPPDGATLPARVLAGEAGTDLGRWASGAEDTVRAWLDVHGAVLFRGFGVRLEGFGAVLRALAGTPSPYRERSSPRTELGDRIYTATDHPADQPILLHNENSYQREFPRRLVFCCLRAADGGGATPLADTRRVLARIRPEVLAGFARRGVRYVRNYGTGLGLSWQEAFQTRQRTQAERHCREQGIDFEWGAGDRLRTSQVRPAVAVHPGTGERVWFNHAVFFHASSLPGEVGAEIRKQVAEADLPANAYYGDGAPIPAEVMDELRAAYAAELVATPWQRGDVLVVDNLLAAHGREPYTGAREVAVGMAGPLSWSAVRDGADR